MVSPVGLRLAEDRYLEIDWSDDQTTQCSFVKLRNACPCASCREKKKADEKKPGNLLPVLSQAEARPLKIVSMRPVGNYAYNIDFSDGHRSGLFTIELLRELGVVKASSV